MFNPFILLLPIITVIGDRIEHHNNAQERTNLNIHSTIETYIKYKYGPKIKSVVSPNVVQPDEPNEIDVEVYNSEKCNYL